MRACIGTAGWTLPRAAAARFPVAGSHLARYATVFPAVEINSSFYRPHRRSTYTRWAESVPADFRFSVKLPRATTHDARLIDCDATLDEFFAQVEGLGARLGCVLVQLPPSLAWDAAVAIPFMEALRTRHVGAVAIEPRHASWYAADVTGLLRDHRIARVAADPPPVPDAADPGGWDGLAYYRLHGSPRTYYSEYSVAMLESMVHELARITSAGTDAWCIFDNTALGAATSNALDVADMLGAQVPAMMESP